MKVWEHGPGFDAHFLLLRESKVALSVLGIDVELYVLQSFCAMLGESLDYGHVVVRAVVRLVLAEDAAVCKCIKAVGVADNADGAEACVYEGVVEGKVPNSDLEAELRWKSEDAVGVNNRQAAVRDGWYRKVR